jgi:signal transduction histidine kinase
MEIGRVADELNGVVEDLREIARGIHPAILSEGGLGPALRTLGRRPSIAVQLDVAALGRQSLAAGCGCGCGTMVPAAPIRCAAPGWSGLKDRIEALGGTFSVHSTAAHGTTVSCELPLPASR